MLLLVEPLHERCSLSMVVQQNQTKWKKISYPSPPGKSYDDKFVFGIMNQQNDMIGLLETLRWYPDEKTWWIGLLLFTPETRSQGVGQKVFRGFIEYARLSGAHVIMLGVVEENTLAYKFWKRMGFEFVRQTEPRKFGNKTQTVSIMRRSLLGGNYPQ